MADEHADAYTRINRNTNIQIIAQTSAAQMEKKHPLLSFLELMVKNAMDEGSFT